MPTTLQPAQLRAEFDAIARLLPAREAAGVLENWILKQLPARRGAVLDVGCGDGRLTRRLRQSFQTAVGIDLSPGMIAEAKRRSASIDGIEYVCTDLFDWLSTHPEEFDCVVSVATLHHVPLEPALRAMARALKPGGRLIVVDLLARPPVQQFLLNLVAVPVAMMRELVINRGRMQRRLRHEYRKHGENETYSTLDEVRAALPNARVNAHLLWRYSLLWQRP